MTKMTLLEYHMNPNAAYHLFGHAILSGKLASNEFKTYTEYKEYARSQGLIHYGKECFDLFRTNFKPIVVKLRRGTTLSEDIDKTLNP